MKKFFALIAAAFVLGFGLNLSMQAYANILLAGRGCCSHHGGVCGCFGGRTKCCDGTFSPSCQCFKDDIKSETGRK